MLAKVAYEAWMAHYFSGNPPLVEWDTLSTDQQAPWIAAADAVALELRDKFHLEIPKDEPSKEA